MVRTTLTVDGQPADPAIVHAPVTVSWGRDDPTSQAPTPSAAFTWETAPPRIGATVEIAYDTVRRFTGNVTAVVSDGARHAVTCHGRSAALGRRIVGAPPWPEQTIINRLGAIGNLVPGTTMAYGTGQSTWWDLLVVPMDVDRKPALELLMDCATKTGLLAYERFDGLLGFEPADWRAVRAATPSPRTIPAAWCRTGVDWGLDVGQVLNRASVGWGTGNTEKVVTDASSIAAHGEHSVSISTILASETAAERLGTAVVQRWKDPAWVLGQVTIDSARATPAEWVNTILGAQTSSLVSLPILDHPEAFPGTQRQLWILEGATEEMHAESHTVTWRLSPAHRYGVLGLRWNDWKTSTWAAMKARTWLTTLEGAKP